MVSSKKKIHVLVNFLSGICIFFIITVGIRIGLYQNIHPKRNQAACDATTKIYLVQGNSMSPLVENGGTIEAIIDYYNCDGQAPRRGDVIILEDTAVVGPYIKTIGAIPGDDIKLLTNGNALIENEILQNKNGELYFFTPGEQNLMSIYIRDGKLQNDAYFVFGENTHTSRDSRKIGAISKSAFRAKVIKINGVPLKE